MHLQRIHDRFCHYQSTIRNYSPATIQGYRETLKLFLRFHPHVTRLIQIDYSLLQDFFYRGRVEREWKATTFIAHHKRLNVFFKWALDQNLIGENPLDKIEKPRKEKRLPSRLSCQEAFRILEITASYPWFSPFLRCRNHAMLATCLYTGIRKRELLNLNMSDVDLENLVLFVRQGKGKKDRVIPIPQSLKRILDRYLKERRRLDKTCPGFFASMTRDRRLTGSGLKRVIQKVRKKAKMHFHLHMLRHTFATLMIEGGCNIYALSKMMGHSDIKTTTHYLSASVDHLRGEIRKNPLNYATG